jgi:hypothetical protein
MSVAIPDYVEAFEGWRAWRVSSDRCDFRLLSVVQETVWPPREELVAECARRRLLVRRARRHAAPEELCACGIYATTLDRLRPYLDARSDRPARYVFGRVRLWGTIVECEQGWRASRAYPAEIIVPTAPASPGGIMSAPPPAIATATSEQIALALSCYAVPLVVLPHTPAQALDILALERGRHDRIGSAR